MPGQANFPGKGAAKRRDYRMFPESVNTPLPSAVIGGGSAAVARGVRYDGAPMPEPLAHPSAATIPAPAAAEGATSIVTERPGTLPSPDDLVRQGGAAHARGDLTGPRALLPGGPRPGTRAPCGAALSRRRPLPAQRLDDALPLLDRAVALVPGEPEFHNNRGLALAAALRNTDAIAAFRRAIAIKPDHAGAWNNLGLALQDAGDVAGAIAAFRRGLSLAPEFPQLHWNLALALLLQGDYAGRLARVRVAPSHRRACAHVCASYPGPRWTRRRSRGTHPARHRRAGLGRRDPAPSFRRSGLPRTRRARDGGRASPLERSRGDGARRFAAVCAPTSRCPTMTRTFR